MVVELMLEQVELVEEEQALRLVVLQQAELLTLAVVVVEAVTGQQSAALVDLVS